MELVFITGVTVFVISFLVLDWLIPGGKRGKSVESQVGQAGESRRPHEAHEAAADSDAA